MLDRPLQLFNSLGRELQEFTPIEPGRVRMYSCGLTVYNYAHVGNLRAYLFTDTLRRALQLKGHDVTHVMNITDVGHLTSDADEGEDKMELAAERRGKTVWEIAAFYTEEFRRDLARLNVLEPSVWCRATDHVQEMIEFARAIEQHGYAYELDDGLYFDTSKVTDYGKLGLLDVAGLQEGARVGAKEGKRHPTDFAIWRRSPPDKQRLMEWHSPWGVGAPGWHLECSVMSIKYLGEHFDIHTGGVDHIPVHHTNEVAQSEAYLENGRPWVRYWLHGEFINLKGAKISKSLGHTLRVTDLMAEGYHPAVYRYFLLQAHYRTQVDFDWDALDGSKTGLRRLLDRFSRAPRLRGEVVSEAGRRYLADFDAAMSADLNTAKALAVVAAAARDDQLPDDDVGRLAVLFDDVLGLGLGDLGPADLDVARAGVDVAEVERLVAERTAARAARDFARSDALRDQLAEMGVEVQDTADGSTWSWH
jgi:cysteinyl-tRNA synthetase